MCVCSVSQSAALTPVGLNMSNHILGDHVTRSWGGTPIGRRADTSQVASLPDPSRLFLDRFQILGQGADRQVNDRQIGVASFSRFKLPTTALLYSN